MLTSLVLFDLDGTVLTYQGEPPSPSRRAMNAMMQELFQIENASQGIAFNGATDRAILRALLKKTEPKSFENIEATIDEALTIYLAHFKQALLTHAYQALGPIAETVHALQEQKFCIGIGTGNVRAGASLKIESSNLSKVFSLECGGYGCDSEMRAKILRTAIQRCEAYYQINFRHVIVIGDTKHDINAAKEIGALAVGVASTLTSRQELHQEGADYVVSQCTPALASLLI